MAALEQGRVEYGGKTLEGNCPCPHRALLALDQPHLEHLRGLASEPLSWKLFRERFWTPKGVGLQPPR